MRVEPGPSILSEIACNRAADGSLMGNRSGLHLSEIIHYFLTVKKGLPYGPYGKMDDFGSQLAETGFVWERLLAMMTVEGHDLWTLMYQEAWKQRRLDTNLLEGKKILQSSLELDGIHMTPDGLDVSGPEPVVEEYKCVSPDTLVLTADLHWKPIGSVLVGDQLAGFLIGTRGQKQGSRWQNAEVISIQQAIMPRARLKFSDGTSIVCTPDHQFLKPQASTYNGTRWRRADKTRLGQKVVKLIDVWSERKDFVAGYIAGAMDGEGCLTHSNYRNNFRYNIEFAQKPNIMMATVESFLSECGFGYSKGAWPNLKGGAALRVSKKRDILRLLGEMRPRRLLGKFDLAKVGCIIPADEVQLVEYEALTDGPVMVMQTSTGNFVSNGLASHNCSMKSSRKSGFDLLTNDPICPIPKCNGGLPCSSHPNAKGGFEENFIGWLLQLSGYVFAWGKQLGHPVLHARLKVFWSRGDYSWRDGTGAQGKCYLLTFDEAELAATWEMIRGLAAEMLRERMVVVPAVEIAAP